MPDRIKGIGNKIVEWWKHFTRRQQMIIVSSSLIVMIAIGILAFVLSRPEMIIIKNCENAKEAATVQELLDGAGIANEVSDNGLVFKINKKDSSAANILLGSNAIQTEDAQLKDILSGSLSTTEADKTKLYKEYQENKMKTDIENVFDNVKKATIQLNIPTDDGTLIAQEQEASAEVFLTLDGEMSDEQAQGLAKMVATGLGNKTTDNISIMDSNMNLLYAGGLDGTDTASGMSYSQLSIQQKMASRVKSDVKKVLLGSGNYDGAEVGVNLDVNFGSEKTTNKEFSVPEGRTQGPYLKDSTYDEESTSGNGGVPGTTSNGEDGTYVVNDGGNSSQTISDSSREYGVNEKITESTATTGNINYDASSIGITLKSYVKYDEDALKRSGALDDMTFDEYRDQIESQGIQQAQVGQDVIDLVSRTTGIPSANIQINAYEEPVFIESAGSGRTIADYLEIGLAILIFALLGFVVFMSTRKEKQAELEPELSVETLLQTTKENEEDNLEDIGFKEKSEARVLIEKFVDEKPEAVASLLRNWLNEDWE